MRILVDATYLYALMASSELFTASEQEFVARRNAQIVVSAASIWDMRLKYRSRRRTGAWTLPRLAGAFGVTHLGEVCGLAMV